MLFNCRIFYLNKFIDYLPLLKNFFLLEYYYKLITGQIETIREKQIIPTYTMVTVFVNKPGNLSDPAQMAKMNSLVEHLERLPESWGESSSMYFVRDYQQYWRDYYGEGDGTVTTNNGTAAGTQMRQSNGTVSGERDIGMDKS